MYNNDTELLFPTRVIVTLRSLRGETWADLIDAIVADDNHNPAVMAFVLMMVRMNGCISCNADSFRAMRGCTQCARQTVRRFRGSDQELIEVFNQSRKEVESFIKNEKNIR
jgi:hypothetical protein